MSSRLASAAIHKCDGHSTTFRPVLLTHCLRFKLSALSLVAVLRIVRCHH
jgi:hypothetical protein